MHWIRYVQTDLVEHIQPFDAVILEYKISELTGIEGKGNTYC